GPAIAGVHWDRYLRASVADRAFAKQDLRKFVAGEEGTTRAMRQKLSEAMLEELHQVIAWDPKCARAHLRLADRLMVEFELQTLASENVMDVAQIREAALQSPFATTAELHAWLERAFGSAASYLNEALMHARRAVEL